MSAAPIDVAAVDDHPIILDSIAGWVSGPDSMSASAIRLTATTSSGSAGAGSSAAKASASATPLATMMVKPGSRAEAWVIGNASTTLSAAA